MNNPSTKVPLQANERLAVSPADACVMLSIGRTNLYRLIQLGKIRPTRLGRRTLIPVSQLRALLEAAQDSTPCTEAAA